MSRFVIKAVERLGTPLPTWAGVYGETAADIASVHVEDLSTAYHTGLKISQVMERDELHASLGNLKIDFEDDDGSLATLLGPASATLAAPGRYFGCWIEVHEYWDSDASHQLRFLAYLDPNSLEWNQDTGTTTLNAFHTSQILRERILADLPSILRPYPNVPTTITEAFSQSTEGAILHGINSAYTIPGTDLADEQARWRVGKLSWYGAGKKVKEKIVYAAPKSVTYSTTLAIPSIPSGSLSIGGISYLVKSVSWGPNETTVTNTDDDGSYVKTTYGAVIIELDGAPDLTLTPPTLAVGATVTWGIAENLRTHYVLAADVPAPVSGSDGQRFLDYEDVDQVIVGDTHTLTYLDTTTSAPRRSTKDVHIIDVDGEKNRVWLLDPLTEAITASQVFKIRRESRDPVMVDGVALAAQVIAPFALDTSDLLPATTPTPVLSWVAMNQATPEIYAFHDLQSVSRAGKIRISRRGGIYSGSSPAAGSWEGNPDTGWLWLGLGSPASNAFPLKQLGCLTQWPEGTNDLVPPDLYVSGDLSAGATIPPNGWLQAWRSRGDLTTQAQGIESTWDGANITWAHQAPSGLIPAKLVHFAAQTTAPGRYIRTTAAGGTWTFEPHTANSTLGASVSATPSGTLPSGNWLFMGMGVYKDPSTGHKEALQAIVVNTTSAPFGTVKVCTMSCGAAGALTVQQTTTIWSSGDTPDGVWSMGGGLVVLTYQETIDSLPFAHSKIWLQDGSGGAPISLDLKTLEILPQTIQPITMTGSGATRTVGGWYALALESYEDNSTVSRRVRFLRLSPSLQLLNGQAEPDPSDATNVSANFRRGEPVVDPVADGSIPCRMVRSGLGDKMYGFVGGRIFQVDTTISRTLEVVKLNGLDALTYLENLCAALLATAVPQPDGSVALVSRRSGIVRVRDDGAGNLGGVKDGEWSKLIIRPVQQALTSQVNVKYTNTLRDSQEEVDVLSGFSGGQPMDVDLSSILSTETGASAIGQILANFFGTPCSGKQGGWVDRQSGVLIDRPPAFWADYRVGDIIPDDGVEGDTVTAWKLLRLDKDLDRHTADVEVVALPDPITLSATHYYVRGYADETYVVPGYA